MSEQPQRPNPADGNGGSPPEPVSTDSIPVADTDVVLDGVAAPTDDTPTVITKIQPRPNPQENLFSGILRGRKLAHFELIEPIGVGGMAAVIRARDTQLDRFVALKILPPEMAADPENIARFHQEARAAARLDHETIARVFFCGEDQNLHFIAFEFVEGENLRTLIDRRGPLPVPEALHYMLQVATGLTHAAERGVVHRDIKPSNLIISPNGRAKLVDMGLARNLGPQTDHGLTQSGVTLGTFDYISPEQALEPRDADVRSDIYSLGCTFYHVLTGQPPVPEGTAARKLHHHQHVPPIDPRQLNPDIPDEVAAILGRMMAKDPRQRYQRPEHLVQHLLQAAHQLGAGGETGDGMLFVDAALPSAPRTRPLLVAGCAAVLVVALVLLIGSSRDFPFSSSTPTTDTQRQADTPIPGGAKSVVGDPGGKGNNHHQTDLPQPDDAGSAENKEFGSWKELADFALTMDEKKSYAIVLTKDLWPDDGGGDAIGSILLRGKKITLSGDNKAGRRVVWTRYVAAAGREWGIDIDAEDIELQHLCIVADNNNNTPGQEAAGVRLRAARQAKVSDCEFFQGNSADNFSSVAVQQTPNAVFERCGFLSGKKVRRPGTDPQSPVGWEDVRNGGKTAVAVLSKASVTAIDCVFGPHATLFRFVADDGNTLNLQRCTALAGDESWALAQVPANLSAKINAENCFFGRAGRPVENGMGMGMAMTVDRKVTAVLVRQVGVVKADYQGKHNCYFNLDAVRPPSGDDAASPSSFADQIAALPGTDENVLPLSPQPWKDKDPCHFLEGPLTPTDLRAAFKLDFKGVPALVLKDSQTVVGMKNSPWGLPEWTVAEITANGGDSGTVRLVDPKAQATTDPPVYRSLDAALADARSGDTIEIRAPELPVSQTLEIKKAGVSLTIRPAKDSHPILILDTNEATDLRPALFRVSRGQLNFEDLEFRIQPNRSGFDGQAVVLLLGDGVVQFSRCVVTLDGRQADVPMAAVTLLGPRQAMMPEAASAGPRVSFENCFIRGKGDLVSALASQPFKLDMTNTLAALTGSLVNVDAGSDTKVPNGQKVLVTLRQVTAYLGGHLGRLHSADLKNLVQIVFSPSNSLLVSAGGKALVHLESKGDPDKVRDRVSLNSENTNYANFSPMLDQQPDNEPAPAAVVSGEDWKQHSEKDTRFDVVKFQGSPLWPAENSERTPAELMPTDFNVREGPKDKGVVDPKKLPEPGPR